MVTYRSEQITSILRQMHKRVGSINASVVVNLNGLLIEAYPPGEDGVNSDQVAALTATFMGLAERTLERLAQGEVERLFLEGKDGVMVIYPSGKQAALAALMEKDTRLGIVLYAVKRAAADVALILGD